MKLKRLWQPETLNMMTHYFISQDIFHHCEIYRRACDDWHTTEQQIATLRQQQADFAVANITQRTKALSAFAERLSLNAETIANAICQEVGRCLPECRAEVQKSLALIQYYVHLAPELLARKTVTTTASLSQIAFEPLGLVLAVMPWNYPVWQVLRFAVPALCAGNACLVKPAPTVGRVTEMLFDLVGDDLPLQAAFLSHDDIEQAIANTDALAFTGSAKTGRHLAQIAGKYLKKCVLELGGSNAFIVFKDADIQAAAKDACHSRFRDAGQSCNAAKRIILVPEIADDFMSEFLRHCKQLQSGDPSQPETTLACLHLDNAPQHLQALVDDAIACGAKLLLGGVLPETPHSYPATVLDCVPLSAKVASEEVFGTVAAVFRADNAENAIDIANHSPFGLGACIYSADTNAAWRLGQKLNVGSVFINRHTSSDLRLPFGGVKSSGFGRELSEFGLYEFVNIKSYWQK